jgi:hypothetical protein
MAAGTAVKKVIKKSSAKPAAAKPAAKAKSNGGKTRRTAEDVRKLVPQFKKHLQGGGKMKELKAEHGFSDDGPIRQALYLEGFDSKGNDLPAGSHDKISATGKALATRLVKERGEGTPWYALAHRTGKSEAELRAIVEEAGGPTGRVYRKDPEKAAKKAAAKKSTAKKVTKKATAAAVDPSEQA